MIVDIVRGDDKGAAVGDFTEGNAFRSFAWIAAPGFDFSTAQVSPIERWAFNAVGDCAEAG